MDPGSKRRLDELISWYVTGTIAEADCEWVEQMVREHPQARAELEWHQWLQREMRAQTEVPVDVGLDGLMRRVRADSRSGRSAKSAGGAWQALLGWLGARPAYAFAMTLVVVQAGIIAGLLLRESVPPEYAETRAIAPPSAEGPVLQVTFKPDVTERDMRLLLIKLGAHVVDGPGQLGDYVVEVAPQHIESAREAFQDSGTVDAVAVLARRPDRE